MRGKATGVRVEKSHNHRYVEVVGLDVASPLFKTRAEAEIWMRKQLALLPSNRQAQERPCITCGKTFESEGAHNRMCNVCRCAARDDTGNFGVARGSRNGIRIGVR